MDSLSKLSVIAKNRPIKFISGNKRIEMSYDYMGRRVWLAYWVNNAVEKERKFMYNDYTLVQEMKWDNSVLKEYIWDPTAGEATKPLIFKYLPKGYTLFYTHDGNKNVSDLLYWATGNGIGAHYEYSPFGGTVVSSSNSRVTDVNIRTENPFRFSSEYHDDELGLIYYNYRHYNPTDGKWINRDPIEEDGGYNLYGMVGNSVINVFDLLGERCRYIFKGVKLGKKAFLKALKKRFKENIKKLKVNKKGELEIPKGMGDPSKWEDMGELIDIFLDLFKTEVETAIEGVKYEIVKQSVIDNQDCPPECITTEIKKFCCLVVFQLWVQPADQSIQVLGVLSAQALLGSCKNYPNTEPLLGYMQSFEKYDFEVEVQTCGK